LRVSLEAKVRPKDNFFGNQRLRLESFLGEILGLEIVGKHLEVLRINGERIKVFFFLKQGKVFSKAYWVKSIK
jgi:hypothetical protein